MHKPMWALEPSGEKFFVVNSFISTICYFGISIYGIVELGIVPVILCAFIVFPFITAILRVIISDALLAYASLIGYFFLLALIVE